METKDANLSRAVDALQDATRDLVRASQAGDHFVCDAAGSLAREVDALRRRVRNLGRLAGGRRG